MNYGYLVVALFALLFVLACVAMLLNDLRRHWREAREVIRQTEAEARREAELKRRAGIDFYLWTSEMEDKL